MKNIVLLSENKGKNSGEDFLYKVIYTKNPPWYPSYHSVYMKKESHGKRMEEVSMRRKLKAKQPRTKNGETTKRINEAYNKKIDKKRVELKGQ